MQPRYKLLPHIATGRQHTQLFRLNDDHDVGVDDGHNHVCVDDDHDHVGVDDGHDHVGVDNGSLILIMDL